MPARSQWRAGFHPAGFHPGGMESHRIRTLLARDVDGENAEILASHQAACWEAACYVRDENCVGKCRAKALLVNPFVNIEPFDSLDFVLLTGFFIQWANSTSAVIRSVSAPQPYGLTSARIHARSSCFGPLPVGSSPPQARSSSVPESSWKPHRAPQSESLELECTLRCRSPDARRAPSDDTLASLLRGWMVVAKWTC